MARNSTMHFFAQGDLVYLPAKTQMTRYDAEGVANEFCYLPTPKNVVFHRGLNQGKVEILYEGEIWCVHEESCFMT
jgi:hypothetical protein